MVNPIKRVVSHMSAYAEAPEDANRIIEVQAGVREINEAEAALHALQTDLTGLETARAAGAIGRGGGQDQP